MYQYFADTLHSGSDRIVISACRVSMIAGINILVISFKARRRR